MSQAMRYTGILVFATAILAAGSGMVVAPTSFSAPPAAAQEEFAVPIPPAAQQVPPARVGRVSVVAGTLAFFGPGDADWSVAQVNLPVAEGGWFATNPQSQAQLRIGPDAIDLAPDSQIDFAALRENVMQIAITRGRLYAHLRQRPLPSGTNEIDLPRGSVWLSMPGVYAIDSGDADQPTRITVFEGRARFVGGGIDRTITAGSRLVISGSDSLLAEVEPARDDEFVRWCRAQEPRERKVAAARVSAAMTGVEELSEHGSWTTVSRYGAVWFPRSVSADWAPYRTGRWIWIEPWGWNWVDDQPWGFAPFHYGRWARIDQRWGWIPGRYVPQPVYAPALVAFILPPAIETAVPVGVADAGPPVGWFPLAPDEVYWPSYTRDPTYIRNVNITNVRVTKITNITNVIANRPDAAPPPQVVEQHFVNQSAATVVPARAVATSAAVAAAAVTVPAAVLHKARVAVMPPQAVATPVVTSAPKAAAAPTATHTPHSPASVAAATPAHPPAKPEFSRLAPAPRVAPVVTAARPTAATAPSQSQNEARPPPAQTPPSAAHAVMPPAQTPGAQANQPAAPGPAQPPASPATASHAVPPGMPTPDSTASHAPPAPNFSRLAPPKPNGQGPVTTPERHAPAAANASPEKLPAKEATVRATTPAPTAARPANPPNFSHMPPAHQMPAEARQQANPAAPPASAAHAPVTPTQPGPGQHLPNAATAMPHAPSISNTAPGQHTGQEQAKERAATEAARQRADAGAASREHAAQQAEQKEKAASDAAARQRAAAEQEAKQQTAQHAQQRAAAQAAAQQKAAQEARQRTAAAHAAAAQQQAAAQEQAKQRAAHEAQQRTAAQAAARQQSAHRTNCGHPGEPACPK
jgi:hypothetical protein